MKTRRYIVREFHKNHFRVSIFGSARIGRKDVEYKHVYELAKKLGKRGIDVVTGGGPGIMEAANSGHEEGAKDGKNHSESIGLGIKLPKEQIFNKSVKLKEEFVRFTDRLDNFMLLSDAVVVASGGVGTMLELLYTWQLMQVNKKKKIPIILLGDMWPGFLKWLKEWPLRKKYFTKEDYNLLFVAKNSTEAIKVIDRTFDKFKDGN